MSQQLGLGEWNSIFPQQIKSNSLKDQGKELPNQSRYSLELFKNPKETKQVSLNILHLEKVFSDPASESYLDEVCSPFLPTSHPFHRNEISFTDFLLPRKKQSANEGLGEEATASEGFNFLEYIKESQSTSQSTKLQSSVHSQEFKASTDSQLDSQEQSLMEFV